jgi:hypothetical protein
VRARARGRRGRRRRVERLALRRSEYRLEYVLYWVAVRSELILRRHREGLQLDECEQQKDFDDGGRAAAEMNSIQRLLKLA